MRPLARTFSNLRYSTRAQDEPPELVSVPGRCHGVLATLSASASFGGFRGLGFRVYSDLPEAPMLVQGLLRCCSKGRTDS